MFNRKALLNKGNWLTFYKPLGIVKGLDAAILLGYLLEIDSYQSDEHGWFTVKHEKITSEITLSPYKIRNALQQLEGIVDMEMRGHPAMPYYRITDDFESVIHGLENQYLFYTQGVSKPEINNGKSYLSELQTIVSNAFKHYRTFTSDDNKQIENIAKHIRTLLKTDGKAFNKHEVKREFSELFANLPEYITEQKRYQSIRYVYRNLNDLLIAKDSPDVNYNTDEYRYLEKTYGEKRAKEILQKSRN